jgi:hypothetical protein
VIALNAFEKYSDYKKDSDKREYERLHPVSTAYDYSTHVYGDNPKVATTRCISRFF